MEKSDFDKIVKVFKNKNKKIYMRVWFYFSTDKEVHEHKDWEGTPFDKRVRNLVKVSLSKDPDFLFAEYMFDEDDDFVKREDYYLTFDEFIKLLNSDFEFIIVDRTCVVTSVYKREDGSSEITSTDYISINKVLEYLHNDKIEKIKERIKKLKEKLEEYELCKHYYLKFSDAFSNHFIKPYKTTIENELKKLNINPAHTWLRTEDIYCHDEGCNFTFSLICPHEGEEIIIRCLEGYDDNDKFKFDVEVDTMLNNLLEHELKAQEVAREYVINALTQEIEKLQKSLKYYENNTPETTNSKLAEIFELVERWMKSY